MNGKFILKWDMTPFDHFALRSYKCVLLQLSAGSILNEAPTKQYASERYISKTLRQQVWRMCESKCTFGSSLGTPCNSTFRLQIEHIHPIALGGTTEIENLTLLCQAHNLFNAKKLGLHRPKQPTLVAH